MIRPALALLALVMPAGAETARVYSGEHGDFTRLVIELPSSFDWALGRTEAGYAFAPNGMDQPAYDTSSVWQRISRARVASLDTDPVTGALEIALACDCHVFPFEYRPGAVVLDVKPGPAPAGSAFEAAFNADGRGLRAEVTTTTDQASADPAALSSEASVAAAYNWRDAVSPAGSRVQALPLPLPLSTGETSLEPLRDALLERIAAGAADGVVDIRLPVPKPEAAKTDPEPLPWSRIRIGEDVGIRVDAEADTPSGMVPAGVCAKDEMLDLRSWGDGLAPLDLLAKARSGLYGEFDTADRQAVIQSVRLHLYLGFGAEAGQQAALIDGGTADDPLLLYRSMARILDGETDPDTPFAAMLDCDGPAALWAALARDRLPVGPGVNRDAILRSFAALPAHLRGHLGSALAEKFLARDDVDAARLIRDAMERAPQSDAATIAIVDAETQLQLGDVDAAQDHALEAVALDGNGAEGLIALVETHFRKLQPLSASVPEALLALANETRGTEVEAAVARATVLALALAGETEAAFARPEAQGSTLGDLWRVVEDRAGDDDFLRHAVLPTGATPPDIAAELSLAIADRLLSLGFADAALTWIGPDAPSEPADRRLVRAAAILDLGDPRSAMDALAALGGPQADALRARALVELNDLSAAARALVAAGKPEEAARAALWQGDWSDLDPSATGPWKTVASLTGPATPDTEGGLLGRGADAIEASVASRAAIDALLSNVTAPDGG